jgi:hypothetical protein
MTDLTQTIIAKSDQLNADDLLNRSIIAKITKVSLAAGEQPIAINYEGDNGKPYLPCKSMRRVLVNIWGSDGNKYVGRSMTLYRDDKVKFGGLEVGGIRISHMTDIKEPVTMALTASKANKKPFTVKPLATTEIAIDPAVKSAGDNAAAKGVDTYTAWLATLPPEVKSTVKHLHAGWTKTAKSVGEQAI